MTTGGVRSSEKPPSTLPPTNPTPPSLPMATAAEGRDGLRYARGWGFTRRQAGTSSSPRLLPPPPTYFHILPVCLHQVSPNPPTQPRTQSFPFMLVVRTFNFLPLFHIFALHVSERDVSLCPTPVWVYSMCVCASPLIHTHTRPLLHCPTLLRACE